jgi:hypothetical protein
MMPVTCFSSKCISAEAYFGKGRTMIGRKLPIAKVVWARQVKEYAPQLPEGRGSLLPFLSSVVSRVMLGNGIMHGPRHPRAPRPVEAVSKLEKSPFFERIINNLCYAKVQNPEF